MNRKYLITGIVSLAFIVGWNALLIQRDKKMFDSYDQACAQIHYNHPNCRYAI